MKNVVFKTIIIIGLAGSFTRLFATTGELRTPLARFPYHYPLTFVDDGDWSFNCYKSFYIRSADLGFDSCSGTKTVPLAQLFFGKSSFKAQEAFYGGTIDHPSVCAALKYVVMKPRFKYQERGFNFGLETEYRPEESKWRFGARTSLPFKVIELERNVCSATMTAQAGAEGVDPGEGLDLSGLVCRRDETLYKKNDIGALGREVPAVVPAYRLDFLTSLQRSNGMPMVEYGDGSLRIAGIEFAVESAVGKVTGVAALFNDDGTCPTQLYASPDEGTTSVVNGIGDLLANHYITSAGVVTDAAGSDNRGAFVTNQNYSGAGNLSVDMTAQGKLYIVPVYNSELGAANMNLEFYPTAVIMMNSIEEVISDLQDHGVQMAEQFFFNNGVHFCQTERNMGIGDLDLDVYVAWGRVQEHWAKLIAGVVFPTGKKVTDPGLLLAQPTGNNGHFEFKAAFEVGRMASKWFGLRADIAYNHVFRATECRAAPFKGATIKNIGPTLEAKVRWGYFTGHVDLNIFHPENPNLGCMIGYEGYLKRCDKIEFCVEKAKEFPLRAGCSLTGPILNDELKEIDHSVIEKDTKRVSHKVRCELFHRWRYCELFAGASYVFAGKNIMKETNAHLGFAIHW